MPGIQDESVASILPVGNADLQTFEIEGKSSAPESGDAVQFLTVGSDYFSLMGASAVSGRDFNDQDRTAALPVAIVNESFAATFWPGEQSLGKRLRAKDRNKSARVAHRDRCGPEYHARRPHPAAFQTVIYVPFRQEPAASAFLSSADSRASKPGGASRSSRARTTGSRCAPWKISQP